MKVREDRAQPKNGEIVFHVVEEFPGERQAVIGLRYRSPRQCAGCEAQKFNEGPLGEFIVPQIQCGKGSNQINEATLTEKAKCCQEVTE